MKTKVEITSDVHQERAKKGDIGYIDGYVRGGDERPYSVVIIGEYVCLVPVFQLKVIN